MLIQVTAFTARGKKLAREVFSDWKPETVHFREEKPLGEWAREGFEQKAALVFVGAAGIGVRTIAPLVKDKLTDSPVLVMDEIGQYVIPILSGHVGGANELARRIAAVSGGTAVITTATDLNEVFAVDVFAKKNYLEIVNKNAIKMVSGKLLNGKEIRIYIEYSFDTDKLQRQLLYKWGDKLTLCEKPDQADVWITEKEVPSEKDSLILRPRKYVIGIGCRKGKAFEELALFLHEQCKQIHIEFPADAAILASIDRKSSEPGLVRLAAAAGLEVMTYSSEELQKVPGEFSKSEFVEQTVGVDNVCERSALLAAGEGAVLIRSKQTKNGMSMAVARRAWWNLEF